MMQEANVNEHLTKSVRMAGLQRQDPDVSCLSTCTPPFDLTFTQSRPLQGDTGYPQTGNALPWMTSSNLPINYPPSSILNNRACNLSILVYLVMCDSG